jgi:hypothetical protein
MQCQEYQSFLVRLWCNKADDEVQSTWCGEIEHIQSGKRWNFGNLDALLAFLHDAPGASQQEWTRARDE